MSLQERIMAATKDAMKNRDKQRVAALRLIKADIQRWEVDQQQTADDKLIIDILSKMLKQRRDAHTQYLEADRQELAAQEAYEMDVIKEFLPRALSTEEITAIIEQGIADTGASSPQDMGTLMNAIKPQLQGRADMGNVSKLVRDLLAQKT